MPEPTNHVKVLLVDDEPEAIDYLTAIVQENHAEMEIIGSAGSVEEAIRCIFKKHPDLVLLDIELNGQSGFDVVKSIHEEGHTPVIIFVTAYNQYALEAFKNNALDYLLKPVDPEALRVALNKFDTLKKKEEYFQKIQHLINHFQPKIRFNTRTGFILVSPDEIVYCKADGNYSELYLSDGSKRMVTLNLKCMIELLPRPQFIRISRFHIVNENYLTEVDKVKQNCVLHFSGQTISIHFSNSARF